MRSGETLTLRDDRVTGLAIRFGGRHEKDRTGEWFSEATELYLDHYIPGAPVWLSHNFDYDRLAPLADASPIGVMESYQVTPVGVWVTSRLTLPHSDARYGPLVEALLGNAMKYSSDSIQHIVRPHIGPDGHVAVWPLAGLSIVDARHAAEPRQPPLAAKAFDAALKAAFPAETAQRAPAGQLYLVQQHRTEAGKAQRASRPQRDEIGKRARSEDNMKGKHAAKTTIEQLNAVVGNAAEILGIEPTLDALVTALQAGPDPEAPMGEETAAKFNDLLAQMAELLGIPGDEVGVDDLINALTQLRGGAGQTEAKPPETGEQPPAKEPAQATQQTAAAAQPAQQRSWSYSRLCPWAAARRAPY